MNFEEYYKKNFDKLRYPLSCARVRAANYAWDTCKKEALKILKKTKAPKVPGMEGLGGYHWEDMDAETFRKILIEEIKKL